MNSILLQFMRSRLTAPMGRRFLYYQRKNRLELSSEDENHVQESIKCQLATACSFNNQQWAELSEKLLRRDIRIPRLHITERNIDGVILKLCADFNLFEAGKSYYDYIKTKNGSVSDTVLSRYLDICSMDSEYAFKNKPELIEIYKYFRKQEIIEPQTAERCIAVICHYEDYWEDSFTLLEYVKKLSEPTPSSYCSIIEACFRFGKVEVGWDMLCKLASSGRYKPKPSCYLAYLDHCLHFKDGGNFNLEALERFFYFLEEFSLPIPNVKVVEKLEKIIFSLSDRNFTWQIKETFVPRSGVCSACRRMLEPVKITSIEFQELSKSFVKNAVIGNNVFLKTTPEEINRFKKFLNKSLPYDIVIDGLNVAYARGARDIRDKAQNVKAVVAHFVRKNKKIVVLGRRHMKNWPAQQMDYVFANASVFLALDLSQDDPLMLYSALKGGESTCIISRDFMRSHLFALNEPRLKQLFRKWLVSHQYQLGYFNKWGIPSILPPLPYQPTAQKINSDENDTFCWHIPYEEHYLPLPPDTFQPPPKWICVQRIKGCISYISFFYF